jgi:hypothetical protein
LSDTEIGQAIVADDGERRVVEPMQIGAVFAHGNDPRSVN